MISGVKRFILWDYRRASWQYDVMVALILIFLFATPREWFRDQPKVPKGSQIFWIEAALLKPENESNRLAEVSAVLKSRTGKMQTVTAVEPVYDSERELKGYMAFARP